MKRLFLCSIFVIIFLSIISFTSAITYSPQLSNPTINLSSPQIHNAQQSYNFNVTLTSYEDPWVVTTVNITNDFPSRGAFVWKDSIGDIDNDGINEIMVSNWDLNIDPKGYVYAFWWNSTSHTWNNQSIYNYTPASDHAAIGWMWNGDFYGNGTRYVVFAIDNGPGDTNAYIHMLSYQDVNGYINITSDKQLGSVVDTDYFHGFQVFDINNDTFREVISGTCSMPGTDSGKVIETVVSSNTTYLRQQLMKHFGAIGIGDLDGDGTMDMVGSSYELSDAISFGGVFTAIYNNTPAGGDWLKVNYYMNTSNLGTAGQGGFIVEVGDVDNDGQNEAILVPYVSDASKVKSVWMVNYYKDPVTGYIREAGNVSIMNITNAEATDGAIVIKDLDGDGLLETYVSFTRQAQPAAAQSMNEIHRIRMTNSSVISDTVLLNYTITGMYNPDESAWSLTSGDIDNDGIDELVVGTKYWTNNHQKVIVIKRVNSSTYADDVLLEFGGVNYSATNLTENLYNYTLYGIEGGNHSYRWWANNTYGNITYINYSYYYIAAAASSVTAYINNSASNLFSPAILSTYLNATSNVTDALIDLMLDGTVINVGLSSIYNWTAFLANGYYNITARINSSVNYTASISSYFLNISIPPDLLYPQFSSTISGADLGVALFNSTIINTNGTVGITFAGVNYTAYNTTASLFQVNISGLGTGTYSYFWWGLGNGPMANYNNSSDLNYTHVSTEIGLEVCSAAYNYSLANFSYRDAGTSAEINASVTSLAITYHTTYNSTYQNYTYTNATGAPYLILCGNQYLQNFSITSISLHTASSGYWPNTYISTGTWVPTNNTTFNTNTLIYFNLLGGTTGLITFQVQNQGGGALSGTAVSVERTSDNVLIGNSIADGSGAVSFVLDMTTQYRLNFTKTGYTFLSTTITPTQPIYTIYLTSITSNISYTNVLEGINYTKGPQSGFLNTSTIYTFWFTVNSTNLNLTNYTMTIELPNGTILNTTTGTNVTGSNLTILLNTNSYTKLYGKYYVTMGNTTYQVGGIIIWSIVNVTAGDNSVWHFINNLTNYTADPAENYTTLWFTFFFIFMGFGLLSKYTGMELMQPGISLIVVMLIVAVLSYVGLFTVDFTPNSFINKWGICGLASCFGIGYSLGRLRDT